MSSQPGRRVACLGSSTMHGKGQAYDLMGDLAARPANAATRFLDFGAGGDTAFNTLQRVPKVLQASPDDVIVLVGGDDVLATVFPKMRRFLRVTKHLPRDPEPTWYEENLRRIARSLRSGSSARLALCSLVPLGEAPGSADPHQRRLNALVAEYSAIVRRIAEEEGAAYLPLYERLHAAIAARPARALTAFRFLPMYWDAFRTVVLHQDLDALGVEKGFRFHTDGIHLNRAGGRMLADLIQGFLEAPRTS